MTRSVLFIVLSIFFLSSCTETFERKRISFNDDWRFAKVDIEDCKQFEFDDSQWRKLNVPHDWALEGPFDSLLDARTGGLPIHGVAWYRKTFTLDEVICNKQVTMDFDGVMSNCEVFLNGHKIGSRPNGYIGFQVDLTPYIKNNEKNVLAVKVAPEEKSARWYTGAGIYRNVWLNITSNVFVGHWGTQILTPNITTEKALVQINTSIANKTGDRGNYRLRTTLIDSSGNEVGSKISHVKALLKKSVEIKQEIEVHNPILWELNRPSLYTAKSEVLKSGKVVDTYETTFGIRTIEFTPNGFYLNGKREQFKGVCLHHDLGPLGAAINTRALQRQLEIMKKMGANAIRTSHNPPAPEQLELCDRMGIMVQVEAFDEWKTGKVDNGYNKYWDEWFETDLRDMIKSDRNHPSVVMWSIGNEVKEQKNKSGADLTRNLVQICHDEDPTRPVTAGFNEYPKCIKNGLAAEVDLVGLNYKPMNYKKVIKEHPDWILYGSETASCFSSRGVYHLPIEIYDKHSSKQISSYDVISAKWANPPDLDFLKLEENPTALGQFVWTGFDYLGEPTPFNGTTKESPWEWHNEWPSRSSYFGIVDLCGFPKDRYYLYQSVWSDEPMVHILPHWNWEHTDVASIPVYCYTNCDELELFLNGKSLGRRVKGVDYTIVPANLEWGKLKRKMIKSPYRLNWNVKYEPGELKVIAYKDGKKVAFKSIVTAGKAHAIELIPDCKSIEANGKDLVFVTVNVVDKDGNFCPLADNLINFDVQGPVTIAAVGNGNASTVEPFQANYRRAFNGKCMLILQSKNNEIGTATITAGSKNMISGKSEFTVR